MLNKFKELRERNSEEGFTLIELMIVVVIIGILAAIAIPIFSNQQRNAAYAVLENDVKSVLTMATTFKAKTGHFPTTCEEWRQTVPAKFSSETTAAIAASVSPDGYHMWVEAQSFGTSAGSAADNQQIDNFTAVIDTKTGKGVMSRAEYAAAYNTVDRTKASQEAGYVNGGFMINSIREDTTTCQTWGTPTP